MARKRLSPGRPPARASRDAPAPVHEAQPRPASPPADLSTAGDQALPPQSATTPQPPSLEAEASAPAAAPRPDSLDAALTRHGLNLPAAQAALVDRYCQLLWDWNQKLNLTRHTDYGRFVGRDLVDALQLAPLLATGERVLDVGTGGGVPGLLLAILRPDLDVTLCDSVQKKARAVASIVGALGLKVPVLPLRAEQVLKDHTFDTLVIRAVGPLPKLLADFRRCWPRFRRMLVFKGPRWTEELAEARRRGLLRGLSYLVRAEYPLPEGPGKSVVLEIRPEKAPPPSKTFA